MGVSSCEIEIQLEGLDLGFEVIVGCEGFDFKELVFDQAMKSFHIGLKGMGRRWDSAMSNRKPLQDCREAMPGAIGIIASDKFRTIIRLETDFGHFDFMFRQVLANSMGESRRIGGTSFISKPKEGKPAAYIAGRILPGRKP